MFQRFRTSGCHPSELPPRYDLWTFPRLRPEVRLVTGRPINDGLRHRRPSVTWASPLKSTQQKFYRQTSVVTVALRDIQKATETKKGIQRIKLRIEIETQELGMSWVMGWCDSVGPLFRWDDSNQESTGTLNKFIGEKIWMLQP